MLIENGRLSSPVITQLGNDSTFVCIVRLSTKGSIAAPKLTNPIKENIMIIRENFILISSVLIKFVRKDI